MSLNFDELWEERPIKIAVIIVIVSLLLISFKGIKLGLDLKGGSIVQLQVERPLASQEMEDIINVLSFRLNAIGLKDIRIRPWGNQFIIVEIAGTTPEEAEKVIGKPGKLTVKVGNITVFTGKELIKVDSFRKNPASGSWGVPFTINDEAAIRFRDAAIATNFSQVSMYLDEGTRVFATASLRNVSNLDNAEKMLEEKLNSILKPAKINITKTITNAIITIEFEREIESIDEAKKAEIKRVINETFGSINEIRFESTGLVNRAPMSQSLQQELAKGLTVKNLVLELGGSEKDREEAKRIEAMLKSGSLPVRVKVAGSFAIGPTLGEEFTNSAILAGIGALIVVSLVVFLRYRRQEIIMPIIATGISEVIIILGFASLINWNIDLPALAGIIAAIGTGVDDQIVITDEVLRGREKAMRAKIKSAFFIIMAAWLTTVAAMLPLAFLGMGALIGFAITTIAGVTIGVFITRPAYATMIRYIIKG